MSTEPETTTPSSQRHRSSSVRVRIRGWYVALLAISLIAALFLQRTFLLAQAEADAEEALDQEVMELQALVGGVDPATGEPFGENISAIFDTFLARNVPLEGEGLITFVNGNVYKTDVTGARIARVPEAEGWATLADSERGVFDSFELGEVHYLAVPIVGEQEGGVFVVSVIMESRFAAVDDVIRLGAIVYGS
ncbi:MAG TPA: hypothetical protein VK969_13430, partial [Acidimicrobiia bacterium]|nr:hypothetical protein [Acidimicrobiia bacterium]